LQISKKHLYEIGRDSTNVKRDYFDIVLGQAVKSFIENVSILLLGYCIELKKLDKFSNFHFVSLKLKMIMKNISAFNLNGISL